MNTSGLQKTEVWVLLLQDAPEFFCKIAQFDTIILVLTITPVNLGTFESAVRKVHSIESHTNL